MVGLEAFTSSLNSLRHLRSDLVVTERSKLSFMVPGRLQSVQVILEQHYVVLAVLKLVSKCYPSEPGNYLIVLEDLFCFEVPVPSSVCGPQEFLQVVLEVLLTRLPRIRSSLSVSEVILDPVISSSCYFRSPSEKRHTARVIKSYSLESSLLPRVKINR